MSERAEKVSVKRRAPSSDSSDIDRSSPKKRSHQSIGNKSITKRESSSDLSDFAQPTQKNNSNKPRVIRDEEEDEEEDDDGDDNENEVEEDVIDVKPHINGKNNDNDNDSNNSNNSDDYDDNDNVNNENDNNNANEEDVKPNIDQTQIIEALQPQLRPRDLDHYIPGSIVRVVLHNFLTYDHVDFSPGPYLNMIIGPNGTGKSTIVCGIALGLGAGPKILGRASDINSFVKQNKDDGYIEIHLRSSNRDSNHVIKRFINSSDKNSKYEINDQQSSLKEIKDLVTSYGIQIQNLCSFLPQDKVSEFAQMSPSLLLVETQKVAEGSGIGNLTECHEKLIESGKSQQKLDNKLKDMKNDKENLENLNKSQEQEIERYYARKAIEKKINLLNLMIPFSRYSQAKSKYDEAKVERKRLNDEVIKIEQENLPLKGKITEYNKLINRSIDKRNDIEEDIKVFRSQMQEAMQSLRSFSSETEKAHEKIEEADDIDKKRYEQISYQRKKIEDLEKSLENPPSDEGLVEIEEMINELRSEVNEVNDKIKVQYDYKKEAQYEMQEITREIRTIEKRIQSLDNVRNRRFTKFKDFDQQSARTVELINNNADKFKQKVYDPPFLECRIKDQSYASAVESLINANAMKTILCQNQDDYDTATRQIIDKYHLRVNIVQPVFNSWDLKPFMSSEEIKELGFDGFAIDFVEAPEFILNYLKKVCNLHKIPIAKNSEKVNIRAIEECPAFKNKQLRRYLIGNESHNFSWSRYGKQAATTMTTFIRNARVFNDSSSDSEERKESERRILEFNEKLKNSEKKYHEISPIIQNLNNELKEIKVKIEGQENDKKKIINLKQDFIKKQVTLSNTKKSLIKLEQTPNSQVEKTKWKRLIHKITKQRAKEVENYIKLTIEINKLIEKSETYVFNEIQYDANKRQLNISLNEYNERLSSASRALQQADNIYKSIKSQSATYLKHAQECLQKASEDLRQDFIRFRERVTETGDDQSLDELEDALAVEKSNLEMNTSINSNVIEQFKARQSEIETLNEEIDKQQRKLNKLNNTITSIRSHWEPTLFKLVNAVSERFSKAFERFGCAGEIKLFRHEIDYSQWAIHVYVKFRENEPLELLTAQRQSGGERSLSTILYLMSLTELSKSPFSLVDEINQGMDSRAERLVHNQMVTVTCQDYSSQYFLITPKLLPNLNYHKKMKVLCVNNGEWLEETRGNLKFLLRQHTQKKIK